MDKLIEIRNLKKHYKNPSQAEPIKALDGVDLTLNRSQVLGLIGESGSGKSTLAKVLVGLEEATSGQVLYEGQDIDQLIKKDRVDFYNNVQMVFQNPYEIFDRRHTIEKILGRALKIHKIGLSKKERRDIMVELLEEAFLKPGEDFLKRYPQDLSGGQLQRIAIVRSMVLRPKFLIADEPVTMLDVSVRSEVINLILDLKEELGTSILFISHDIATTSFVSRDLAVIYLGQIVELAKTEDILASPSHPYSLALLSNASSIYARRDSDPIRLRGDPPKPIGLGNSCYFANRCFKARKECFTSQPALVDRPGGGKVRCFFPVNG